MWLLLHGFTGAPASWDRVCAAAKTETALRPWLLGHGADWRNRCEGSFSAEVVRIADLARSHEPPRWLCGYSMGARVGLGVLSSDPGLFAGAVLIGVHPGLGDDASRESRRDADAEHASVLRNRGLEAFLSRWESLPLFDTQKGLAPDVLATQRRIRSSHEAEGLAAAIEALGLARMPSYVETLIEPPAPMVLMAGSLDDKFAALARRFSPRVDVRLVEGVGHNVVLEAPEAVASAMHDLEEATRG